MDRIDLPDQAIDHLDRWLDSHIQEIKEDHAGKFIAFLESGEALIEDEYVELIHDIEDMDVDLESVRLSNIPKDF